MKKKLEISRILRTNYDYEEDSYDRLVDIEKRRNDFFTNRAKMKKAEYDYEEDAYEPEMEEG